MNTLGHLFGDRRRLTVSSDILTTPSTLSKVKYREGKASLFWTGHTVRGSLQAAAFSIMNTVSKCEKNTVVRTIHGYLLDQLRPDVDMKKIEHE